jgi:Domain of unknown function (DUF4265)
VNSINNSVTYLSFALQVEDDWPPVGVESIPFELSVEGYKALSAPLFVKDLSVDDIIRVKFDSNNIVESWEHVSRSCHSTIWLLRLKQSNCVKDVLVQLRALGCNTTTFKTGGCYAVDVPESVPISQVDLILQKLDTNSTAVAFPSLRHCE